MSARVPRVVIVGGGFGGLNAAQELAGDAVEIVLVDRSNHHLFQPLLYQVAMAGVSPADIAIPIRAVLRQQKNCRVLLAEVTAVDLAARELVLDDRERLGFDRLILATGAKTNFFGNDRWGKNSLGLKTLDDAVEIRRRVLLAFEAAERERDEDARQRLLTFVVIGGGPTGVELAGGLAEVSRSVLTDDFRAIGGLTPHVVLIEAQERLLPGIHPELAQRAKEQLQELGVEVRLGVRVQDIDDTGVDLPDGERIDCPTVLWTAGVRARSLAEKLGAELDRGGRVKVQQDCSLPGYPEVFAIGDMACFVPAGGEPEGSQAPLPGVAPVAMQQGRHVARQIRRSLYAQPSQAFTYTDKGLMATVGRSRAVAQSGPIRLSGFVAWLAWLFVHLMYLVGFRNRVVVLFSWAWSYVTYKRGARLITGDASWRRLHEVAERADRAADPRGPGTRHRGRSARPALGRP